MYWSKRAYLIALLAEELRVDITKYENSDNKYLCDVKKKCFTDRYHKDTARAVETV